MRAPRVAVAAVGFAVVTATTTSANVAQLPPSKESSASVSVVVTGFVAPSSSAATAKDVVVPARRRYRSSSRRLRSTATTTTTATATASEAAKPLASSSSSSSSSIKDGNAENDHEVSFPPPLSRVDRLQRAAKFWSSALPIVASYYGKSGELLVREKFLGERITEEQRRALWDEEHAKGSAQLASAISSLKGFYVKTAQIIASRQDLFPPQYTEALSGFTDNLDPMPPSLARAVVSKELLHKGEAFDDIFSEFDDVPLGAASVAQVHRAVLTKAYGGPREVAVKIQRPAIESKLMGDIANLKALAKPLRDADALPLDYYTVFVELEKQLADEFDFVAEAVAMDRIRATVVNDPIRRHQGGGEMITRGGTDGGIDPPLVLPRPVPGLVSKRVLVMDYLRGVPLSRARDEMINRGIDPDGPEAKVFGRRLLCALTDVFGRCILGTGFFHADPHPGNIFVLDDGRIGLIDFGQVKQISGRNRETLAKVMVALTDRKSDDDPDDLRKIGNLALELGVELHDDAKDEAAAAVAMWLFDSSVETLPGGYDKGELSPNSPVKELKSFPQDLVLVGRSSILIKGLSSRLGIPWSLAKEWSPIAREVLDPASALNGGGADGAAGMGETRVRFRDVIVAIKRWGKGRASLIGRRLPPSVRGKVAAALVRMEERRARKEMTDGKAARK